MRPYLKRCERTNKVIFKTELDAKIVLMRRWKADKGEVRVYQCGTHWHLTSMPLADPSQGTGEP